jgi:hypothetical protein
MRALLAIAARARIAWVLASLAICVSSGAGAFTLKSLIMPGKVIAAHASIEEKCDSCHESNETQKQSELCFGCHKEVRGDLVSKSGFHGRDPRVARAECSSCHHEHEGRDGVIAKIDAKTFDHMHTDFPLVGAHAAKACTGCHAAGSKFRDTPRQCNACHASADPHKGALGTACEGCHTATAWSRAEFDHAKTKFALAGAHAQAQCSACHGQDQRFAGTPTQCMDCHREKDVHKGRNGAQCGACHQPSAWPVAAFDHAARGFKLAGKHQQVKCESCHAKSLAAEIPRTCVGCHASKDPHAGSLGTTCGDCHTPAGWRSTSFDHAKASGFALHGAHSQLECSTCHTKGIEAPPGRECASCHGDADPHRGQLGAQCSACHADTAWAMPIRFDHGLVSFPLLGKHSQLVCTDCHASKAFHDASSRCADCHAADDPHSQRFGAECATCHNPSAWQSWVFDHDRKTSFALTGAHRKIACESCHRSTDAGKSVALRAGHNECGACHRRDDPHNGQYGAECGACHSTDSFSELRGR